MMIKSKQAKNKGFIDIQLKCTPKTMKLAEAINNETLLSKLLIKRVCNINVVVAEWLRRWTRNPLGFPRAGSNPADYGCRLQLCHYFSLE